MISSSCVSPLQSPLWSQTCSSSLVSSIKLKTNYQSDSSLFFSITSMHTTFILFYVDDILVTSSSQQFIQMVIHELDKTFTIKDLGHLHYFFGIEAQPITIGLLLTQTKYTYDLLLRTHLDNSKPIHTYYTHITPFKKS